MAKNSPINLWFYVNPDTQAIDKVLCYHPLGVNIRAEKDWTGVIPQDAAATTDPGDYQIYDYDWEGEDAQVELNDEFDFDNYDHITPTPLKQYDSGTLTVEDLKQYAKMIYDGTRPAPEFDSEDN